MKLYRVDWNECMEGGCIAVCSTLEKAREFAANCKRYDSMLIYEMDADVLYEWPWLEPIERVDNKKEKKRKRS
jgi:hypothetical protein